MIMKKVFTYIIVAVVSLGAVSCRDFLEKAPVLSQSTEITLSSYDGLDKATLGAYATLAGTSWYGGERILEGEMRSGNGVKNANHNSNRYATQQNWNYTSDATSGLWSSAYVTISRANNVIDALETIEGADPQDLNNLKAENLFIRALSHFDLVTLFAQPYSYATTSGASEKAKLGVPYVFHTDPAGEPARETVAQTYDYIVADLLEAEKIIDPGYVRSGVADKKAAVSIYAIQALLSRVYLYMGQWQNAANYATKVIESGAFELYNPANYVDVWKQATGGSEVIFEVYIDINNRSNLNPSYMTYPGGAYGDCLASPELIGLYEDSDIRLQAYTAGDESDPSLYWTLKYAGKGVGLPEANNTVVLRLSEMYLNRAEAIVRGASVAGVTALSDLSAITEKRGASAYGAVGMEAIKAERRKELAWEGHYFFDKARWNDAVVRPASWNLNAAYQNISFPSYRWALPIPKRELEVNHNLVQNENY